MNGEFVAGFLLGFIVCGVVWLWTWLLKKPPAGPPPPPRLRDRN